jgi:hypothetical protein
MQENEAARGSNWAYSRGSAGENDAILVKKRLGFPRAASGVPPEQV